MLAGTRGRRIPASPAAHELPEDVQIDQQLDFQRRLWKFQGAGQFVLLLIVGEATQQAVLGKDYSLTNAFLVILTLIGLNVVFVRLKRWSPALKRCLDGAPIVVVADGKPVPEAMKHEQLVEDDILTAARELQGLERMDQIKYAVLESTGTITIIPKEQKAA